MRRPRGRRLVSPRRGPDHQHYRARSYGALAKALLAADRRDAAHRYVAYQCQETRWIDALPVLLAVKPDAAKVLA